jgi:hypothetical protein
MKKTVLTGAGTILISFSLIVLFVSQQSCKVITENSDYRSIMKFEFVDPLEKVLVESSYFPPKEAISEVVRGEHATLQFAVRSVSSITGLKANVSQAVNGDQLLPPAKTGFVGYVKVGRSIWDYSRDRIVSGSGYYPDPVLEQESIDVEFGNTQPIWVSIPVPVNAQPGVYKGKITISGLAGKTKFAISKDYSVKVYPVTVEKTSLWVTNWFSLNPSQLRWMNGGKTFEPYTEQHWGYIRTLAKKMADYKQNVAIISPLALSEFTLSDGKWNINFTNFDKVVDIFIKEGVIGRIEGGHIGGRESTWTSQFRVMVPSAGSDPQKKFDNLPMSDPAAQEFYKQFIVALNNHLKEKGWDKFYMQHIADEPIEDNIKSYIEIAQFVKKMAPDLRLIDACHTKNLGDLLDIWVPQLDYMNKDYEFYNKQNNSGKEAWFYTCLNPKGEYVNRFIELPMLKTRFMHWVNFKYNIPGYLPHTEYWSAL